MMREATCQRGGKNIFIQWVQSARPDEGAGGGGVGEEGSRKRDSFTVHPSSRARARAVIALRKQKQHSISIGDRRIVETAFRNRR